MFSDSTQRYQKDGEMVLSDNYTIPTLKLNNVEVKNLLYDYEALVYVELDNLIVKPNQFNNKELLIIHFGDKEVKAAVMLTGCKVYDSSFSLGMIFVPMNRPKFIGKDDIYYQHRLH